MSLPYVTEQATFWESAHRVQWSSAGGPWSWGQVFEATVEGAGDGTSVLSMTGHTKARVSLRDRSERAEAFQTLVAAMTAALADPHADTADKPTEDRVRRWNGREWTIDI